MNWTTKQPTQEGFYWRRPRGIEPSQDAHTHPEIVRVFYRNKRLMFESHYESYIVSEYPAVEWHGPLLPPPESAAQGDGATAVVTELQKHGAYEVIMEVAQWMDEVLAPSHKQLRPELATLFEEKAIELAKYARTLLR